MEKEWIYVYVYLNHFAVYLKLTQHCKSTILQYKLKIKLKFWNKIKCEGKKKTGSKKLWIFLLICPQSKQPSKNHCRKPLGPASRVLDKRLNLELVSAPISINPPCSSSMWVSPSPTYTQSLLSCGFPWFWECISVRYFNFSVGMLFLPVERLVLLCWDYTLVSSLEAMRSGRERS